MIGACGSQGTVTGENIESTTADRNENGLVHIAPPEGVTFDSERTVEVFGGNTLIEVDLVALIPLVGIPIATIPVGLRLMLLTRFAVIRYRS